MSERIETLNASVFIFGKVPGQSDFVRYNASGPDVRSLDQWIQEGMVIAAKRFDKEWDRIYREACGFHFLFQNEHSLCGFLRPSFDRSERKYPFIIALRMENAFFLQGQYPVMPLVLKNSLEEFRSLVAEGINGLAMENLILKAEASGARDYQGAESPRHDFDRYLESTTVVSLWERLFGARYQNSRSFLERLSQALDPLSLGGGLRMSYGLRFPFTGTVSEREHEICFWLSVCQSMIKKGASFPFMFWKEQAGDEKNHLYVFFTRPPGRFFLHLIDSETDDDTVYDLDLQESSEDKDSEFNRLSENEVEIQTQAFSLKDLLNGI